MQLWNIVLNVTFSIVSVLVTFARLGWSRTTLQSIININENKKVKAETSIEEKYWKGGGDDWNRRWTVKLS